MIESRRLISLDVERYARWRKKNDVTSRAASLPRQYSVDTKVGLCGANGSLVQSVVVAVDADSGMHTCQPIGAGDTPVQLSHSEVTRPVAMEDARARY